MAELNGAEAEHLVRVLRTEPGDVYEISDDQNAYLAEVAVARKSQVVFRVGEKLPEPAPTVEVTLMPALFKFDRFEWMVEKATELGVAAIEPWPAIRSEQGLAQAAAKRRDRWQKIAHEASQQARRWHLPQIKPVAALARAVQTEATVKLLLDEDASALPIGKVLPEGRTPADRVALLSGPEGGWTPPERAMAQAAGWQPCSLGPSILRAETAAIAGLAVIQAWWL